MASTGEALLVPGHGYGLREPLFAYARELVTRAGLNVRAVDWTVPPLGPGEHLPWVRQQVEPALSPAPTVIIGKSLGTLAAPLAAERGLPAVWLTPPFTTVPELADALAAATAPFLLVGGTGDTLWDSSTARRLTPYVLEVPGADHSMLVPGPLAGSALVLGQVCTAVEDFLAGL